MSEVDGLTAGKRFSRADVDRVKAMQQEAGTNAVCRAAFDRYFTARRVFRESRAPAGGLERSGALAVKRALVAKAQALDPSRNLGQAAKALQAEWTSAGHAGAEDQALWTAFRAALDAKFAARPQPTGPSRGRYESTATPARQAAIVAWLRDAGVQLGRSGVPTSDLVTRGWAVEKRGLTRKETWVRTTTVVGRGWVLWRTKTEENALATQDARGKYDRSKWSEYWEVDLQLVLTPDGQLMRVEHTERRYLASPRSLYDRPVEGGGIYDGATYSYELKPGGEGLVGEADWNWGWYARPARQLSTAWAREEYRSGSKTLRSSSYGDAAMSAVEGIFRSNGRTPPERP